MRMDLTQVVFLVGPDRLVSLIELLKLHSVQRPNISCKVIWIKDEEALSDRLLFFCIEGKCMTGKVTKISRLQQAEYFELDVAFIDPEYFENEAKIGNRITLQESSRILSEGIITKVFK